MQGLSPPQKEVLALSSVKIVFHPAVGKIFLLSLFWVYRESDTNDCGCNDMLVLPFGINEWRGGGGC